MAVMHRNHEPLSYLAYSVSETHAIEEPDTCLGFLASLNVGSKPPTSFSLPSLPALFQPQQPPPPPPHHHHSVVT